jgi:acyl carrier protein
MGGQRDTILTGAKLKAPPYANQSHMQKIISCLTEVFPECDPAAVTNDTRLGGIPGWDSMNSINLLMALEATFAVSLADDTLTSEQKVADIAALLRSKGIEV